MRKPDSAVARLNRFAAVVAVLMLAGAPTLLIQTQAAADDRVYDIHYEITPRPGDHAVEVRVRLRQREHLFREMRFETGRATRIAGDGEIVTDDGETTWRPPARGGELRCELRGERVAISGQAAFYMEGSVHLP